MAAPVGPNVTITFPEEEFIALLQPFVKEINDLRQRCADLEAGVLKVADKLGGELISMNELLHSVMTDVDLLIQYHDAQKDDGR